MWKALRKLHKLALKRYLKYSTFYRRISHILRNSCWQIKYSTLFRILWFHCCGLCSLRFGDILKGHSMGEYFSRTLKNPLKETSAVENEWKLLIRFIYTVNGQGFFWCECGRRTIIQNGFLQRKKTIIRPERITNKKQVLQIWNRWLPGLGRRYRNTQEDRTKQCTHFSALATFLF